MYWYVPVYDIWYWISLNSEGYISGHAGDSWVHTLSSWIFCKSAGPSRFACRGFMHQHMHWTKAHYIRFIDCCLAAPLPVPASARPGAGAGLLGDAAVEGLLCPTRLHDDQWPASDALCVASSNGRLKDLSLKIWHWSWWAVIGLLRVWQQNIEVSCQFQRFNQRDKTMSWSGMKLRREDGDWDLDFEQWLECQASEKNPKYASNPAKFRYLIREIKQWIGLGWSWAVQMVVGTSRSDGWNVEDVSK